MRWPEILHPAIFQVKRQEHPSRGRGGFMRGRGRFNAVQTAGSSNQITMQGTPSFAAQQPYSSNQRSVKPNQCIRCKGYGHWASECPSYRQGCPWWKRIYYPWKIWTRKTRRSTNAARKRKRKSKSESISQCLPGRVRTRSSCTAATGAGGCPSARASKAGKLTVPRYGQCSLLGARSECLGRHDPRARASGFHVMKHRRTKRVKT